MILYVASRLGLFPRRCVFVRSFLSYSIVFVLWLAIQGDSLLLRDSFSLFLLHGTRALPIRLNSYHALLKTENSPLIDRPISFSLSLSLSLFYFHAKRNERHMEFLTKNHNKYQLLLVGLKYFVLFVFFKIYWPTSQCWKSSFETRARLDQLLH